MRFVKINQGPLASTWPMVLFVCVLLMPLRASSQAISPAAEYAVEVAALRSQDCAAELTNGLLARGFEAYWVPWVMANQPELGAYYRVRVGRFQNLDLARNYAEELLDSGLLDTCSITVYEPPLNSIIKTGQPVGRRAGLSNAPIADSCPVKLPAGELDNPADLITAISKNRWLLSASRSVIYTLPSRKTVSPAGDVVLLMRAVDKNRWRLRNDISIPVAPSPPAKQSLTAQSYNPAKNPGKIPAAIPNARLGSSFSNIASSLVTRNSVATAARPVVNASNNDGLTSFNSPRPVISETRIPEISRTGSSSAVRALSNLPPPRLQGAMEMRDGQLMMRLKNMDYQRSFNGVARITVSDDKELTDVAPVPFALRPNEERVVPVNDVRMAYGDWMLMVYDDRQAVQLVRSAPFGQRPAPVTTPSQTLVQDRPDQTIEPGSWKFTESLEGGPPLNGLPNVTGVYDTTGNGRSGQMGTGQANAEMMTGNLSGEPANTRQPESPSPALPGQITISPRLIAATAEKVTIELDIAAPQPLSYVRVSLRSGNYQDERYALLSSTNGRIPFLIPAREATGDFSFAVKDEKGSVLAGGSGDFRRLGRGN